MTVLIDTCIVIDLLQKRESFFDNAHAIFLAVANHLIKGCLSAKTLLDISYIMHHYNHSNNETKTALSSLCTLFDIIDTKGIDCKKALLSQISDYEDAVMVETAVREGVECIITRNTKDFLSSAIPVISPEDFVAELNDKSED